MKLMKCFMMTAMMVFAVATAKDDTPQVDIVTQYQQKSGRMAELAENADNAEVRRAYITLSQNYALMAAMKQEAGERAARGEAMDWSDYHRLQGDNRMQEAVIARHRAGQRGGDENKPHEHRAAPADKD